MTAQAHPEPGLDLTRVAENLVLSPEGVWVCPGHRDLGYDAIDGVDWLAIEERSFWYRHRNRCLREVICRFPPRGTLFEVGAGNGTVALALQTAGIPVVAIEPTVGWARNARKRGVHQVVCATLEDARFREGTLENAGMFDVLEHIPEDEKFLRTVRSLMPEGGRFYCAVPALPLLWSREDEAALHVRRYRLAPLCRAIERAGFRVEFGSYYFAALVLPIFLLRALPSRLGIRTTRNAATSDREHRLPSGAISAVFSAMLEREVGRLAAGKRGRLGASCLVVAHAR